MDVLKIHDKPVNGYVTVECEFTEKEINFLVDYAVNDILRKQIEKLKESIRICFDCGQIISEETLQKFPDTEICGDCLSMIAEDN